jgi:hypothetical protein
MIVSLDVWRPLPAAGTFLFPSLPTGAPQELTRESVPSFAASFDRLMSEMETTLEDDLPGGSWRVAEFINVGCVSLADFRRASGEVLMLGRTGETFETFVGRSGRGVIYGVANEVDGTTRGVSTSYQMACFGEGVERLRGRLGLADAPLFEVALGLGERIFRSGQYPNALPADWKSVYDFTARRIHLLERGVAETASLKRINIGIGAPGGGGSGALIPEAFGRGAEEYLGLTLDDESGLSRGEPKPLVPGLQRDFWDFADLLIRSSRLSS